MRLEIYRYRDAFPANLLSVCADEDAPWPYSVVYAMKQNWIKDKNVQMNIMQNFEKF